MPRSALRNPALYPPGPEPRTSISHSMSGLPEYVAPLGAGARGRASTGVARADCEASAGRLVSPAVGGGEAGFAGAAAAPAASNVRITLPSLTLSPTLTLRSFTVPAAGEGTSIVALSDSSVTSESSAFTASPGLTKTSITGTSLKSPMSGTLTSIVLIGAFSFDRGHGGAEKVSAWFVSRRPFVSAWAGNGASGSRAENRAPASSSSSPGPPAHPRQGIHAATEGRR